MLRWQTERLLSLEVERDRWTVYVRPELVVEIAFSDVQESPRYPAKLALRFARVKRNLRANPPAVVSLKSTGDNSICYVMPARSKSSIPHRAVVLLAEDIPAGVVESASNPGALLRCEYSV